MAGLRFTDVQSRPLEFFPVHHTPLPVRHRGTLVEHIAIWLPLFEVSLSRFLSGMMRL